MYGNVLADEVGISLLLVVEGLKVLLDFQPDHGGWLVSEVVDKLLRVHGAGCGGGKSLLTLGNDGRVLLDRAAGSTRRQDGRGTGGSESQRLWQSPHEQ